VCPRHAFTRRRGGGGGGQADKFRPKNPTETGLMRAARRFELQTAHTKAASSIAD